MTNNIQEQLDELKQKQLETDKKVDEVLRRLDAVDEEKKQDNDALLGYLGVN